MKNIAVVSALLALTGCASIVDGTKQTVSIETRNDDAGISGASCRLSNGKGTWYVTTPGSVEIHRAYAALDIECRKTGVEDGHAKAESSTKGMAFGNAIFGGLVGTAIDVADGAAYDYPTLITVFMGKTPVKPGPANVVASSASRSPSPSHVAAAAAVENEVYRRNVPMGSSVQLASHAEWDGLCRARPVPAVTIVQQPQHGHIEVAESDFVIRRARVSSSCIGQTTHGSVVTYVPDKDYRGTDRMAYRVTSPYADVVHSAEVAVQ
jgi:hypothetical protein